MAADKLQKKVRLENTIAVAACVVMFCILVFPVLGGKVYEADDLGTQHLPFRWFYWQALHQGDSFLWMPEIFCGYYAYGEGQTGMLHPLHLLLYRFLSFNLAFNIEMMHTYPLMLLGLYFFLRRQGIGVSAALAGGFLFAFSGYTAAHFVHMHVIAILAHLPWLLLCIDVAFRSPIANRRIWAAAGAGLLTASQLMLGHPQHVWFSLVAEAAYALYLVGRLQAIRPAVLLGLFTFLGVMAAGVQILPSWDVVAGSVRADPSLAFRYVGSLHPLNLLCILNPFLFKNGAWLSTPEDIPHEFIIYNGAFVPILMAVLWVRRKDLGAARGIVFAFSILGALSLLLALGKFGLVYRLQTLLPFVGMFRCPSRYIVLYHLASAILVAVALMQLRQSAASGERASWRKIAPVCLPLAAAITITLVLQAAGHWASMGQVAEQMTSFMRSMLGIIPILGGTVLLVAALCGSRYALAAFILFGLADLGMFSLKYFQRARPFTVQGIAAYVKTPPTPPPFRLECGAFTGANEAVLRGLRFSSGNAGMYPKKELDYSQDPCRQVAGVLWVRSEEGGRVIWRRTGLAPLGRAWLVCKTKRSSDPNADIGKIDPSVTALTSTDIELPSGTPGIARIISDRPGRINIATEASTRQLLVLSESFHSGWVAKVDGAAVPVLRAYGDFMACVIEPGNHEVEFGFAPASFRNGCLISAAGIALMALSMVFLLRSTRQQKVS